MAEYAPAAIRALYDLVARKVPGAQLSGILGDSSHTYGYHRCRAVLPADDYSVQLAADRLGDAWAASALDVSLPAATMRAVSARLMAACKANDPRLGALREWFGTVDGVRVTGWDRHDPANAHDDTPTSSDDSHLWHVHLSIYRRYANDAAALAPIADVMAGVGSVTTATDWLDMATEAQVRTIVRAVVDERLTWHLPRIAATLRFGGTNKQYNSKNAGALVDGKGIDGTVRAVLAAGVDVDALAAHLAATLGDDVVRALSAALAKAAA